VGASLMSMVGAGLGAMVNGMDSDEDRKKYLRMIANMPVSELARGIYFPYKDGLIRIRVPEQFGSITALMYMGVVNHYTLNDYKSSDYFEAMTEWIPDQFKLIRKDKGLFEGAGLAAFSWIPTAIKPGIETILGMRTFPDISPIVPQHMSSEKKLQYTAYTSDTARWLGEVFNTSPALTEHFIRNQFGAMGGLFLWKFQANPMYRQMQDYTMKGKLWNDFYENKALIKVSQERLKGGALADPKEHWDLHIENKLYSKMGDALQILREVTLAKYDDLSAFDKKKAKTIFGSMPSVSKKVSEDMFDLITEVTNYDYSEHTNAENLKNTANMMLRMKGLTIEAGRPVALTIDKNFIKSAVRGKPKKQDAVSILLKQLKSSYVNNQMKAGQERLRAGDDWDYLVKEMKSK